MRESMTLIEQANIFNKTTAHQNLFFDRLITKKNIDVYTTRSSISTTKHYRSDKFSLPPIEKDDQRARKKIKRPLYRTSLYHSSTSSSTHIELSPVNGRGKKVDLIIPMRDDQTVIDGHRHHAPPPSPSDDQVERILSQLNRTRQSSPQSSIVIDGNVPYRLPALSQSATRTRLAMNCPAKDIKSTLSNYLQAYY